MVFQRQQRYWLVLSRHSQPWKADREGQQRCDVGRSATQASFTPSTSPTKVFLGRDQVVYASMQQRTFELKSPKLSSWEDSSPSRSTANNQKCCENSSRSFCLAPFRTRTHALPVFMQVIYCNGDNQGAIIIEADLALGIACALPPPFLLWLVACCTFSTPPYLTMVRCGALETRARKSMVVETSFASALVRECTERVRRTSLRARRCCQVVAWL